MTSDRGNTEGAELQLTTPVTPKTAGLNPNATVFLSSKTLSVSSAADTTTEWESFETNDYAYANGDMGKSSDQGVEPGEGGFSPSDSPLPADAQILNDNQNVYSGENATSETEEPLANENVSEDQLRQVLKERLEICFSRETLASDSYLQSQMDSDQYLPIATVANLQQIQEVTSDTELITELLRESPNFQVDEKGEKVRPNHNRCIVILREIPDTTPVEDVKALFSGESCPKFVSCEFAHNDNWYVTFDSDADAQQAYQYLRENVKTFLGKPIMARIKAKPLIKMTYPRNGYKRYQQQQAAQQQAQQQQTQQQQQQQQQTTEQQQQQFPIQQLPLMPNVGPYLNGQQIPFFTSSPAILPSWPTSPTLLDPSMVLAMNGYQATSVKINPPQSRPPFPNVNRNNRNQKPHRQNNQDRMNAENRLSHDRQMNDRPRTSPRNSDSSQMSSHHSYQGQSRRGDNSLNHSHAHSSIQQSVDNGISNRQSDSLPPSQRRSYRSRRRKDDDGARISRQSMPSSQTAAKDNKSLKETQFELENNSFPPLPGPGTSSSSSSTAGDIFDSKMSDVVKGTAKPQVREVKPQRVPSPVRVPSPPTPPPASAVTSSTMMVSSPSLPPQAQKEDGGDSSSSSSHSSSINGVSAVSSVVSSSNNSANVATVSTDTRVPTPPVSSPKTIKSSASTAESQQKISEPAATRVVAVPTQTHVKVVDKPVMSVPVKLSYAQMVQKGRENEATAEINQSEDSVHKGDSSNQSGSSSSNRANQTLKEQSQTIKPSSTANSRHPVKEQGSRKDFEPKDQRLNNVRRSKENRERKDRRRERGERDGSRSSNK